jgi:hypothetical protein
MCLLEHSVDSWITKKREKEIIKKIGKLGATGHDQ